MQYRKTCLCPLLTSVVLVSLFPAACVQQPASPKKHDASSVDEKTATAESPATAGDVEPPPMVEPPKPPTDEEQIKKIFQSFRSALTNGKGENAADLVSADTIERYQKQHDVAVSGDEATVKRLPIIDRMSVLLLRHQVFTEKLPAENLKVMDGRAVFAYSVNEGWIGKDSVMRAGLEQVVVSGDGKASAHLTMGGKLTPEEFHFLQENGSWRVNLVPTLEQAEKDCQGLAQSQGKSEDDYLFEAIKSLSGRDVDESIWKPLE